MPKREPWVIPHDIGTFLVRSRSVPDVWHSVDVNEQTCTCESYEFRSVREPAHKCWHLQYLNHLLHLETLNYGKPE